jgi:hypothetical protein
MTNSRASMHQAIDDWAYYMLCMERNVRNVNKMLTNRPPMSPIDDKEMRKLQSELLDIIASASNVLTWARREQV